MGGRYEIDGCEFGSVKAQLLGGVEHFAFAGIVDENLKVFRAFLNHDPQSIPFGFVLCFDSVWKRLHSDGCSKMLMFSQRPKTASFSLSMRAPKCLCFHSALRPHRSLYATP
jgi:hypothetical protein